jgi:hypothetical protein
LVKDEYEQGSRHGGSSAVGRDSTAAFMEVVVLLEGIKQQHTYVNTDD